MLLPLFPDGMAEFLTQRSRRRRSCFSSNPMQYVFGEATTIWAGARPSGRFTVRSSLARGFSAVSPSQCYVEAT